MSKDQNVEIDPNPGAREPVERGRAESEKPQAREQQKQQQASSDETEQLRPRPKTPGRKPLFRT